MSHPHSRSPFWAAAGAAALVFLGALAMFGCDSRRGGTGGGSKGGVASPKDIEANTLAKLEAQADVQTCRTVLQQLDAADGAGARPALSESERAELAALLKLTPGEVAEIGQPTFSQADAYYLEECLLVRAGTRALKIDSRPPLERARLAFDWVCRQVYVENRVPWPANPWTTLEAGSGIALSRAYVVLAAWQQLGLDGCLVGPPALKTARSVSANPADPEGRPQYAPVRACGVLIEGNLYLFDHTAGRALTAADGKDVLTLAAAQKAPESARGFEADEVKTWHPYIVPPLPGVSRRMEWLEQRNPGNAGVRLFVNATAQKDKFGPACQCWNPDGDALTATRVLARYASDEGGTQEKLPMRNEHRVRMIPMDRLPRTTLDGEAFGQLAVAFLAQFETLRYAPNTPRDLLLRGQYTEATSVLKDVSETVDNARARMDQDTTFQKDFQAWANEFQRLTARRLRPEPGDPGGTRAAYALEQFRNAPRNRDIEVAFVRGAAARPLGAEVKFLTAQCVHERAERLQIDGSPQAPAQWKNAAEWWLRFLDASAQAQSPFPAREPHARQLLARCQQFAGK
jgi:hypothetical protein